MDLPAKTNRIPKKRARVTVITGFVLLIPTFFGVSAFSVQSAAVSGTEASLQQFVGIWQAKFKGKVFETIMLKKEDGKLTGTASRGEVELDTDGELTSAQEVDGTDPIVEAKLTGNTLRITSREESQQETIQFDMKLTGADQAELRIVTPPGVRAPRPWKLERTKGQ